MAIPAWTALHLVVTVQVISPSRGVFECLLAHPHDILLGFTSAYVDSLSCPDRSLARRARCLDGSLPQEGQVNDMSSLRRRRRVAITDRRFWSEKVIFEEVEFWARPIRLVLQEVSVLHYCPCCFWISVLLDKALLEIWKEGSFLSGNVGRLGCDRHSRSRFKGYSVSKSEPSSDDRARPWHTKEPTVRLQRSLATIGRWSTRVLCPSLRFREEGWVCSVRVFGWPIF